jgi:hypothetical protein
MQTSTSSTLDSRATEDIKTVHPLASWQLSSALLIEFLKGAWGDVGVNQRGLIDRLTRFYLIYSKSNDIEL